MSRRHLTAAGSLKKISCSTEALSLQSDDECAGRTIRFEGGRRPSRSTPHSPVLGRSPEKTGISLAALFSSPKPKARRKLGLSAQPSVSFEDSPRPSPAPRRKRHEKAKSVCSLAPDFAQIRPNRKEKEPTRASVSHDCGQHPVFAKYLPGETCQPPPSPSTPRRRRRAGIPSADLVWHGCKLANPSVRRVALESATRRRRSPSPAPPPPPPPPPGCHHGKSKSLTDEPSSPSSGPASPGSRPRSDDWGRKFTKWVQIESEPQRGNSGK